MLDGRASRFIVAAALLAGANLLLRGMSQRGTVPLRQPLTALPLSIAEWVGTEAPIQPRLRAALGVDEYVNRIYQAKDGGRVQLYIGYYASQRTGDTIHSPKNCIPGAGWEPVGDDRITIPVSAAGSITVNEYAIRKGPDRQRVFYWYQGRGRIVASEYSAKLWMVHDAIARNRTDGALVRVVTDERGGVQAARERAAAFTRSLWPLLKAVIPD